MVCLCFVAGCERDSQSADVVFTNGTVFTVNPEQPEAQAVAVSGNKISYVGSAEGVKAWVGKDTRVVDMQGGMLLPGFVDSHIHLAAGTLIARGVDLLTDDRKELFRRIREYAEQNPELEVITGYGWRFNVWDDRDPTAADLDAIDSTRPIFLWAVDGHKAWVNSKALEVAGIDKNTEDPAPGFSYFKRDEDGTPTGYIIEVPAQISTLEKLLDLGVDYTRSGMDEWMPKFSAAGVTTVLDAGIQGIEHDDAFSLIREYEDEGKLPFRIVATYYWNNGEIDPIPLLEEYRDKYNSELLQIQKLKINMDGDEVTRTALLVEPYADDPAASPKPIIDYEVVTDTAKRADEKGFDVFCHCLGDLAVRRMIDSVEKVIAANPERDRRNAVSHAWLIHPDDLERLKQFDISADMQLSWAGLDPLTNNIARSRIGDERMTRLQPAKPVLDAGARLTLSSDWPVAAYAPTYEPLKTLQGAVTRQGFGETTRKQPALGGEGAKLSLEQAIRAHTLAGAYLLRMDDKVGSIEVGKLADLVLLQSDIRDIDPYKIGDTKVVATMMNGKFTHDESAKGSP
ncbi:hypothetical protein Mag101_11810 [Microbulbifer agarilyticus]|uniref:Amidohydrolase 3 domain-containing protein n=1 Tax=Microbulbifer agarilyticus TaxID=260552 RepID=A0A1Q2MA48_9GAMM|nr:hypothetical protein Mag101_11810 [Microbulbifer agarilyticus]